jgi:DNA-binding beta-propeller fold protein YncE
MLRRRFRLKPAVCLGGTLLLLITAMLVPLAQQAGAPPDLPGVKGKGVTLLPNGWRIAPEGRSIAVGDFPMSMVLSKDGRYAIVSNNGWSKPSLTVVDLQQQYVKARVPIEHAWLGLAWHPSGDRLYSSGAAENTVNEFTWQKNELAAAGQIVIARSAVRLPAGTTDLAGTGFIGGLAIDAAGARLYAVHVLGRAITLVDVKHGLVRRTVDLPAEPYTALLSQDGATIYVSLWGGAKVLALDAETLATKAAVAVGEHPNALALSRDGSRLFVACANTNKVWALDLPALTAREQISVSLFPNAPAGTTPNALAVSPDGGTLAVANADNNTVAIVDIEKAGASEVEGFIPTGWYPTAVQFTPDGKRLVVLAGKGMTGQANPRGPQATSPNAEGQYIGQLLQGALSIVTMPDAAALKALTTRVYAVTPYSDAIRLTPANAPVATPIPRKVGDSSPIKYVFYVIRENRTYDQVLGDLERGNGDPNLTIFGEDVTPNAHALAREFVTLDNFYVDAEVSYDGHAFSTAAYATDAVEKIWPTNYGRRGGVYTSEGGWGDRNAYGNLSTPADGYLWDFAARAGVSVRSYGEFAHRPKPGAPIEATVPGLRGKVHPEFEPFNLDVTDNVRVDVWLKEFRTFEKSGSLPRLNIIRLGNDHTLGSRAGALTPRSMVADNDLALGRVVEAIAGSAFWKESAIFVLEDDAQNGPDHVDSHRSVAFVVSPFTRRRALDSTLYTTSGMLRTMELILGLPPMSQYDAAATPMYNAFQPKSDLTPYKSLPARVRLDERNAANAWGADASQQMNFAEADMTPEYALNEILWKSVRGAQSPMPPPVRAGFIRIIEKDEEEEAEEARKETGKETGKEKKEKGE